MYFVWRVPIILVLPYLLRKLSISFEAMIVCHSGFLMPILIGNFFQFAAVVKSVVTYDHSIFQYWQNLGKPVLENLSIHVFMVIPFFIYLQNSKPCTKKLSSAPMCSTIWCFPLPEGSWNPVIKPEIKDRFAVAIVVSIKPCSHPKK